MGIITDIKEAKGKNKRQHIYIDNEFVCTLDAFTTYKNKLKVGNEISKTELEDITFESEVSSGFERAVELVSKNLKTKRQMREYLKDKGYLPRVIGAIIDKMLEYKFLNDELYAEMYVNSNISRYGTRKIKFNLEMRGIDREIIDNILENAGSQEDAVLAIALKYMKNKEQTRENLDKMCRYLAGKGFSWSEISSAMSKIKEGDCESWY